MTSKSNTTSVFSAYWQSFSKWFDSYSELDAASDDTRIDWLRAVPFILMHLTCLLVFVVGWSPVAIVVAVFLYGIRMFAITAFYHRYFSHKAFKTSRVIQFIGALIAATSVQRGPLWWASHHRLHHIHADKTQDQHSPSTSGFWWSHMGWFLSQGNFATRLDKIKDFARYPELRLLDRFDIVAPIALAILLYIIGEILPADFHTSGAQLVVWGFISTVVLYHATFTINSLAHKFGRQHYASGDDSRNNGWLALITFGEGWHNNHHYYPGSARQGFFWWEIDFTFYALWLMEKMGLIRDLRPVPERVLLARK